MEKIAFKFIQKRKWWFSLSSSLIILGIFFSSYKLLSQDKIFNLGIDFTGGSSFLLDIKSSHNSGDKNLLIKSIRSTLKKTQIDKVTIQITNNNLISIKTIFLSQDERRSLLKTFEKEFGKIELLEADIIGPSIGQELKKQALWMILSVVCILLLYITIRFELYYGIAAILALLHDVLVVLSISIIAQIEINTAFVAAILTILGYSINDTIVVFDRIRENIPVLKKNSFEDILDISIHQTLRRTFHSSATTLLVCLSLLIFGGITIQTFSLILFIGFLTGTYSSIFFASPILFISGQSQVDEEATVEI